MLSFFFEDIRIECSNRLFNRDADRMTKDANFYSCVSLISFYLVIIINFLSLLKTNCKWVKDLIIGLLEIEFLPSTAYQQDAILSLP